MRIRMRKDKMTVQVIELTCVCVYIDNDIHDSVNNQ
jgi:hypothetical protein